MGKNALYYAYQYLFTVILEAYQDFFPPSDDTILEQLASDTNTDDIALITKFISASKDRTVKPESVTVDLAVKGL